MSIVFFDFETGGLMPTSPNIQLAAVAVDDNWAEIEKYEAKIQFDVTQADPEALRINHFDADTWKQMAIPERDVIITFTSFLKRHATVAMTSKRTGQKYYVARLAGHNAATFDGPRLTQMYGRNFLPAHPQVLDTIQLAMWHWLGRDDKPVNLRLESICKHLGVELDNAHDALCDVRGSIAIARSLIGARVAEETGAVV